MTLPITEKSLEMAEVKHREAIAAHSQLIAHRDKFVQIGPILIRPSSVIRVEQGILKGIKLITSDPLRPGEVEKEILDVTLETAKGILNGQP